tara:strand:- start:567 stop:761 length:195 start_codon:yes stop_codon:yes gene_type:complete
MNSFYWCYSITWSESYGCGYWVKIMANTPKEAYKICKRLNYKITKIKKANGFWNSLNKNGSIKN